MSVLDKQIAELQRKKNKVLFIEHLWELVDNASLEGEDTEENLSLRKEVCTEIEQFFNKLKESIETGREIASDAKEQVFNEDEIQAVKALAKRLAQKTGNSPMDPPEQNKGPHSPRQQRPDPATMGDKIDFALKQRHLANKNVQFEFTSGSGENLVLVGKVVGVEAPYLQIQTPTKGTVNIEPEKVRPV